MCEIINKICINCGCSKPITDFHEGRNQCSKCLKIIRHNFYVNNRDEILKYAKQNHKNNSIKRNAQRKRYRTENKELILLSYAKERAKQFNLEINIDVTDIVIPDKCPILGIDIKKDNVKQSDNSPTIDRIDSSKGYIKGNVCVISWRANHLKNNGSLDEFRKIVKFLEKMSSV